MKKFDITTEKLTVLPRRLETSPLYGPQGLLFGGTNSSNVQQTAGFGGVNIAIVRQTLW